jgi:putative sterol carrier protein
MALFGTAEWAKLFVEAVNSSKAYEEAAKTWEGDFYFIVEPGAGVKEPMYIYVDLWHGKCRKAEVVLEADKDKIKPEFVIAATIPVWRKVNEKKLDSIQAMVTRQMKLQGNMGKIMRAVKAAQELVNAVGAVKTEYPGE